jgi:hypothetical protein
MLKREMYLQLPRFFRKPNKNMGSEMDVIWTAKASKGNSLFYK